MAKRLKSENEVDEYLEKIRMICADCNKVIINMQPRANGKENKTLTFMAETGLGKQDFVQILQKLKVSNYSYTEDDRNRNFPNEEFWFFGIDEEIIDEHKSLYIKLKIKKIEEEILLVMSFYPERPVSEELKLEFPYKKC